MLNIYRSIFSYLQVCQHFGVPADPDNRDFVSGAEDDIRALSKYVKHRFPCLEMKPSIIETCMYTVSYPQYTLDVNFSVKYLQIM